MQKIRRTVQPGKWISTTAVALAMRLLHPHQARSEDHADAKYEYYQEEAGRISVSTAGALFDVALNSRLSLRGQAVYDAISGATPTGAPPPVPGGAVPLARLSDERAAGVIDAIARFGRYTLTPQVAYSTESDYESWGVALNQSFEFNQKNTTLNLGLAHNFDTIFPAHSFLRRTEHKDSTDVLIGLTQLLGPKTVLTANFTHGYADGYLSDPYKIIQFLSYGDAIYYLDRRPRHRDREVGFLSLTHFVTPANASFEVGYRIHRDSFGIWSHTAAIEWFQKIGRHVVISPSVRYYTQSAAGFYTPAGGEIEPDLGGSLPEHFSADYRLSRFHAWTYGIKATVKFNDRFSFDLAYRRYEMAGDDKVTSASAYPKANVYAVGASIWF